MNRIKTRDVEGAVGICRIWLAVAVLFCSLLLFFAYGPFALASDGQKERVLIFSRMNEHQTNGFYALLEKRNPEIDGSFRPSHLDETDVAIYLLNSWEEALSAPGAQEMPQIFERVNSVRSPAVSYRFTVNYDDGSDLTFIFYSAVDAGYPPLKCFAFHAAIEVSRQIGDTIENSATLDCTQ